MSGILFAFVRDLKLILMIYPIMILAFTLTYYGWLYSIGVGLHSKLPEAINMKLGRFKVFMFAQILYMLFIAIGLGWVYSNMVMPNGHLQQDGSYTPMPDFMNVLPFLIPAHLFIIFCAFYCNYFVSKELRAVEVQQRVRASDYIGDFLMFIILIIGIWFIQPRINRVFGYSKDESHSLDDHMTLG
jgi:hypothetical protein